MNKNEINRTAISFKDVKLFSPNLRKINDKPVKNTMIRHSNSFQNSLKRVFINNNEMLSLKSQKKIKMKTRLFRRSFILEEEDYNKLVNQKIMKVGKILNKIPHPSIKTENESHEIKINPYDHNIKYDLPHLPKKSHTLTFSHSKSLNHTSNKICIKSNGLIEALKAKISNFFALENRVIKGHLKVFKRKNTLYKYITDEHSQEYFNYFSNDFNFNPQASPEYKFIKIKDESFKVIRALLKVKQIIIDDFNSHRASPTFKCVNQNQNQISNMIKYLKFILDCYQFYSRENDDLLQNYSVLTKDLMNDNNSYVIYIKDLCSLSESIMSEEKNFKSNHKAYLTLLQADHTSMNNSLDMLK